LLTKERLLDIKKNYPQVKEFKLSLDGFKSHDTLRVGSDHKHLLRLIPEMKRLGFKVVINTIVLRENQGDLWRLYQKLTRLGVDRWRVDMPFLTGNYKKNVVKYHPPDPRVYTRQFAKIIKHYERTRSKMVFEIFNLYKSEFRPNNTITWTGNIHPCEYKRELLSMKANGDVIFCPSMDFAMSNFVKAGYKLERVFKQEAEHSFYKIRVKHLTECTDCRYLKICGGGCRCNPLYEFKDMTRRDTSACYTFPFWEKQILPVLKPTHRRFFQKLLNIKGTIPTSTPEREMAIERKEVF
jgi:radical SAM protein with 4Fe4S-binding SPASM domain